MHTTEKILYVESETDEDGVTDEVKIDVIVEYEYFPEFKTDFDEPPEPADILIHSIKEKGTGKEIPVRYNSYEQLYDLILTEHEYENMLSRLGY